MNRAFLLIIGISLGLTVVFGGCQDECDCGDVPMPAPVPAPSGPAEAPPVAAPVAAPASAARVPAAGEIGWDFAQRLLKPLGRELEYVKLALKPDRLAEIRASDFHAFSLSDPGILLFVAEFPTPAVAAASAGSTAAAMRRWGLMEPWDAAVRHNLVLVVGFETGDLANDGQRELCEQAVRLFGLQVDVNQPDPRAREETPPPDSVMLSPTPRDEPAPEEEASAPTVDMPTVTAFIKSLETELLRLWIAQERAHWVNATFITDDTEILVAQADERVMEFMTRKADEAKAYKDLGPDAVKEDEARKLHLLRIANPLPAPADGAKRAELARIAASMKATYGKGKYCPTRTADGTPKCYSLGDLSEVMAKSRDYGQLVEFWTGWRRISISMRRDFEKYVALANEGARDMGFDNLGDLWKSGYDMSPDEFQAETERLWGQLEPFYADLHCYVRGRLRDHYGEVVSADGPIPAHLLGNMWAQDWTNIFDLVAPEPGRTPFDLTKALQEKEYTPRKMVETAEAFFVSLGLPALPGTFWERSMFTKPRDREVVCHASAWDIDWKDDLRIKMCIRINGEDFTTIHHELGHNYYQRAYLGQPTLFRNSANDGFHEALGDVISLSVTPAYLKKIGLMPEDAESSELNMLMHKALEKIAFLPFGLLIDRWRWEVFAGNYPPEEYNNAWWALRLKYQGIASPEVRPDEAFDPGAKYHIPANVPYTRYFLAAILQFQFHRALCKQAGHEGPLHACSIYGSEVAGKSLDEMMKVGLSRPWPEALEAITGGAEMDAGAIVEYFAPLSEWLKTENKTRGYTCGW